MTSPTVTIPFRDYFAKALLDGTKHATSRTKKMGDKGDIFHAFGGEFEIRFVKRLKLETIAKYFWKEEGADSPDDFKRIWSEIHPRHGYNPEQIVYFHGFELIAREE